MQHFQVILPKPHLQPYIQSIMLVRHLFGSPYSSFFVPRGVPALICTLEMDGSLVAKQVDGSQEFTAFRMLAFGQTTSTFETISTGNISSFLIALTPQALSLLMRDRAADFTDVVMDITDYLPGTNELFERFQENKDLTFRVGLLEAFLFKKFCSLELNPFADFCFRQLSVVTGTHPVRQLSKDTGISERTIQRLFNESIGVSPKKIHQIFRFRRVMQELLLSPDITYLDQVATHNYYDQSHLVKDFHQFTGRSPESYLFKQDQMIDRRILKAL